MSDTSEWVEVPTAPQCPEGLYNPKTDTLIRCGVAPGPHEWHESEDGRIQWRDPMAGAAS